MTARRWARAALVVAVASAAACEPPPIGAPDVEADSSAPPPDAIFVPDTATASDTSDGPDTTGLTVCTPGTELSGCPEGLFCESTARVCVECVGRESRCAPDGQRETCEAPLASGVGALISGGFFEPDPCDDGDVCVPSGPIRAECVEQVCEPNARWCVEDEVFACNSRGTDKHLSACDPGKACYQGSCEYLRHNVLIIFDTSGSMHDYIDAALPGSPIQCEQNGTECLAPFPVCDQGAHPITLLGLAKNVFSDSVREAIGGFAQFALQRFPQVESGANQPNCWLGWYLPLDGGITGDDDAYETVPGGWFDLGRDQAFVVPFPLRNNLSNRDALLEWLDHEERLGATDQPCASHNDCGTGRCGSVNGEGRCFYHTDNELRAGGSTPLGKSLFYAGEYFRRYVVVDGKPCQTAANCGSSGYLCRDGACVDPYRRCRDNFIILFTDGEESEHQAETDFFNPVIQARRLAFGLDCASDTDCRGGASCDAGACVPPGGHLLPPLPVRDTQGHGALASPDGQPISIKTTVITLEKGGTPASTNLRIAVAGGGVHLDANADDPEAFKLLLLDAMSPNFKCAPEDL